MVRGFGNINIYVKRVQEIMNIHFQTYEISKKFFIIDEESSHPEDKKIDYRRLFQDYKFYINGYNFTIKKDFWWDGASIPQFLWSFVGGPWHSEVSAGALIHDVLYLTQIFEREFTDKVFHKVNSKCGMGSFKNKAMYSGVRMGGWKAWKEKTPEMIIGGRKHLFINDISALGLLGSKRKLDICSK